MSWVPRPFRAHLGPGSTRASAPLSAAGRVCYRSANVTPKSWGSRSCSPGSGSAGGLCACDVGARGRVRGGRGEFLRRASGRTADREWSPLQLEGLHLCPPQAPLRHPPARPGSGNRAEDGSRGDGPRAVRTGANHRSLPRRGSATRDRGEGEGEGANRNPAMSGQSAVRLLRAERGRVGLNAVVARQGSSGWGIAALGRRLGLIEVELLRFKPGGPRSRALRRGYAQQAQARELFRGRDGCRCGTGSASSSTARSRRWCSPMGLRGQRRGSSR